MTQTWSDLLFAHWPVSPAALRPLVPSGLEIDVYAGNAWVGVVPFCIPRLAPRGAPRRLGLAFPELNVRTYVTAEGKPGVWFFSLDAASALAVVVARATYHLPYFWARMRMGEDADAIDYTSRRRHPGSPSAEFAGRYWPSGPVFVSDPEAWSISLPRAFVSTPRTELGNFSAVRSTIRRGRSRRPMPSSQRTPWPRPTGSSSPARPCSISPAASTWSPGGRSACPEPAAVTPDQRGSGTRGLAR
jgi:hypothetical protein